jgi:hypothetical protein
VLLERSHERVLVLGGLEATVTELGAGVDELQLDVLQSLTLGVDQQRLSEGENPLLGSNAASLDHDEILLDLSVVREASHGVDGLVGQIVIGGGVVLDQLSVLGVVSIAHVVDLLVDLGTMVVTLLTGASDGELDAGRMPGADASDLAETLVSLAGQLLRVPTRSDTLESLSLGDTDAIDHLVLGEDLLDGNLLLEVIASEVNLIGDGSTVQLDLDNVSLLLTATQQLLLGVADHADHLAILLHLGKVLLDLFLAGIVLPLLAGLGERLLLRLRPVLEREAVTQTKNRGEGGERKK